MDLQENMYEFARRQLKYSLKGRLYIYAKTFPNLQEKKGNRHILGYLLRLCRVRTVEN